MLKITQLLYSNFPNLKFKEQETLAPYTTVKIGGPAEVFYEVKDNNDLINLTKFCKKNNLPVTILGLGANTLIADRGIKGLVIKNSCNKITILSHESSNNQVKQVTPRLDSNNYSYQFNDLDYQDSGKRVLIKLDAGVVLTQANQYLLKHNITGLQWYARIPSTLGGAVYNNVHGGTHFIAEVIKEVTIVNDEGEEKVLNNNDLQFAYDYSSLHNNKAIITSVTLNLFYGDVSKAQAVTKEWRKRKSIQPMNSLGCIFQNISNQEKTQLNLPTTSIGYIIDKILNMKDFKVGDAQVSKQHSAFIINTNNATAKDYLALIKLIMSETKEKLNLDLKLEISLLGFNNKELEFIT